MKNEGDKTMKKVLLTSAVALAAFGAVQAVSADSQAQYSNGVVPEANQYKPATPVTNPYAVRNRIGKDGKVLPDVFGNGTHVRVHVKDIQGNPVAGAKVAALVYATVEDFDNYKKPALIEAVTDAAGDVEFPLANGGYVVYRIDEAPKGYFVPAKLTVGTLLDAEEVVREGSDMFVTGELVIEKTDTYNVAKEEWVQEETGWKYYASNKAVTGWKQVDGKWFFFNAEGVMQKWWVKDGNTWYYLNGNGEMQTGWLQDGGTWYYLNGSGAMATGWAQVGGTWYYLNSSGAMKTGWLKQGGSWYYLDGSGAMKTGWFQVDGKWYYAYSSGALAVSTTVDGYYVNANGEWV